MDKSYRIHTNIAEDTLLQVNMKQDFDFLEVLSLKLRQKDAYRIHSSNYGVIIGRVLANDAFGIPNAKLSIFIERDENDPTDMELIYPYKEVTTKDKEGRRYNMLPDYSDDDCYRVVGTFPNKRLVLDDDTYLEVYDKYWKYTTVTNNAGDYMIFGVPTGSVTVHVDIDLSDIGVLSQRPSDFEYKGYNLSMFDSPTQFKESTNLDNLAQLFSQNRSVFVYPFWGDADNGIASITRADIQIQYKFEPTCVFMGSIVSDNEGHAIGHKCAPDVENGMNDQLIAGNGTIEMIRKTTDGLVEEYQIQGNQLIDENGVWCYQIPMNLDYIGTDEYGNIVPTDNPNKGIPTRTQVRFRFSKNETSDEGFSRHTAKYLVPMNPIFSEDKKDVIPTIQDKGSEIEKMYTFGSATPLSCFRDLYWNNVYSVKNYIPKTQVAHRAYSKNYCALKGSNLAENQNPIPFNKLRIDLPFLYMIVCIIYTMIVWIVTIINAMLCIVNVVLGFFRALKSICLPWPLDICPFEWFLGWIPDYIYCIALSAGVSEGNVAYYPGCWCGDYSDCPEDMEGSCEKDTSINDLLDKIQRNLAQEFKIIKLDMYQDWVNGCLYMPLWYWRKRKKKTFLFFTLSSAKNEYCSDKSLYSRLKTYVTCNIGYTSNDFDVSNSSDSMPDGEERWHKNKSAQVRYKRGLIKPVENKDGLTAYYYAALQATTDNDNADIEMNKRGGNFKAVRLFATDIILLGNLNPKNIYGIPQFFKCLPSTTANIPAVATIQESIDPNEKEVNYNRDTSGEAEDSGTTITTGMDWNHDGDERTPAYSTGLFMDLACTYVGTRAKSCINVERLSELGVAIDMTHNMAYHEGGNSTQYGQIDADGFISKYELDDMENRAMFATLNHIGFIPQEYQDLHDAYATQVPDKNTNYLIPKFKYMYPVDFDGRLQLPMNLYNNGFEQALFDEKDETYITFRMGAEEDDKANNSEGRIRHFYHADGRYDMPLYNNSFYFYFGIKKGSTAIDKFNKMFYAPCFQNSKKPFTLDIEYQGRSYCPDAYSGSVCGGCADKATIDDLIICRYSNNDKKNHAYGYIKVSSDDIKTPYSYKLYDQFDDIVIEEYGMTKESFVIGGQIDASGNVLSNCNGWIYTQLPNDDDKYERIDSDLEPYYTSGLTNQEYVLEVTDADGRTITEKIKLDIPKISGSYKATPLSTKFYNSATTRIDYVCSDENMFYGQIEMTHFSVDGYKCKIEDVKYRGYRNDYKDERDIDEETGEPKTKHDDTKGRYTFCVTGSSDDISSNVYAYVEIYSYKSTSENLIKNCLCDSNTELNDIAKAQSPSMHIAKADKEPCFLGKYQGPDVDNPEESTTTIGWFVYQPNKYSVKITQACPNKDSETCDTLVTDNSSEEIINIMNGGPFITSLNTMPTKFMLGTESDSSGASVANTSYFYKSDWTDNNSETQYNIKGWYGLHQEDTYMFSRRDENKTYNYNQLMWQDFYSGTRDDIAAPKTKRSLLKFKFDKMFSLAEGAYILSDSSGKFTYESRGGISPILYRMVTPMYSDLKKARTKYLLKDGYNVQAPYNIPNIVADNYSSVFYGHYINNRSIPDKPHYNSAFYTSNPNLIGNYFAAFTRDGSYITKSKIDSKNIKILRSPSFASVSPMLDNFSSHEPKQKGKDVESTLDNFGYVYKAGSQSLKTVSGNEQRNVQPYLRALFVDRRLDFDVVMMAPSINGNVSLYANKNRDIVWKGGRISGWTYNGIEMSYDEDYNVISAHTHPANYTSPDEDVEYSAATFNKRLEYTYKYDCAHKCLDCGYEGKDVFRETPEVDENNEQVLDEDGNPKMKIVEECPICHHHNIQLYHGEILDGNAHAKDNINFNSSPTLIPGIVKEPNEKYYTFDDAVTYYHKWKGDWECDWNSDSGITADCCPKWGRWNVNYNISGQPFGYYWDKENETDKGVDKEEETNPLIKQYYESMLNEIDLRHLYWSLFNYKRLGYYTSSKKINQQKNGYGQDAINNNQNPFYVYHYPFDHSSDDSSGKSWYNGDFNRDDVVQNTESDSGRTAQTTKVPYPTKRFIDIGNLPQSTFYTYETASCSYNMKSSITDDGGIRAETSAGERISIDFDWTNPIKIMTPSETSEGYANITYKPSEDSSTSEYICFTAETGSIRFIIKPYSCGGFYVHTKTPKLIQVLPYITDREIDGIGFLKTCNPDNEFGGKYGDNMTLNDAINTITLNNGDFKTPINFWLMGMTRDIYMPEDISLSREDEYRTKSGIKVLGHFFKKNNNWLVSDDDDFSNIVFEKNAINLYNKNTRTNASVFTVLIDREYWYTDDDNLVRHIRSLQTSDLFDCRTVYLKKALPIPLTYVKKSGSTLEQILTIDMKIENQQNQTLADYETTSYVFKFKDKNNQTFDVSPSDAVKLEYENFSIVRFTLTWSSDMGILADPQWSRDRDMVPVELFATTSSNFIYKLTNFKIKLISQDPIGNNPGNYSTNANLL